MRGRSIARLPRMRFGLVLDAEGWMAEGGPGDFKIG